MARPLAIIHGWSDTSNSFRTLAAAIAARRNVDVKVIALGDYVSMSDFVTFDDLVAALDRAWSDHGFPRQQGSVDTIVHSTGSLVIRDWLSRTFKPATAPVKNLVMLAPANFGSPLAHKGRSFIGRVVKGFTNDEGAFQTGERILKGLELASSYSWSLALRDRFGPWASAYGSGGILCTVLVGDQGYSGIRAIANEDGSDGTVRLSTANLNCAALHVNFADDPMKPTFELKESGGKTAFAIMPGHNHGSITLNESKLRSQADQGLLDRIIAALDVADTGFVAWCAQLARDTAAQTKGRTGTPEGFQNTVVRVIDHEEHGVPDYLIEFFEEDDDRGIIAKLFHTTALKNVHVFSDDASYRSLYVDCGRLAKTIDKLHEALSVSLTAHPSLNVDAPVGFRTFSDRDIGAIRLKPDQIAKVFRPHRTLLATIRLRRERDARVFRFKPAGT